MLNKYNSQKIVDRMIKIFGNNVNIFDKNGIMLASGDDSRLATFHAGALVAIKENRVVQITSENIEQFEGVKCGVNLPIYYRGEVQGVVGITGEPEEVSQLATILKEMVELLLGELERLNLKSLEAKAENAFLRELLSKKNISDEFEARGQLLGVDLTVPRVCIIVEILEFRKVIEQYTTKYSNTYEREIALQVFKNYFEAELTKHCGFGDKVFHLEEAVFIILKKHSSDDDFNKLYDFSQKTIDKIKVSFGIDILISIGETVENTKNVMFSFKTARTVMKIQTNSKKESSYLAAKDCRIHTLVLDNKEELKLKLEKELKIIWETNNWDNLKHTLNVYMQNNMNILQTSKDLMVHRNTVIARLTKIKEILNLDPMVLDNCFILNLLLVIDEFS